MGASSTGTPRPEVNSSDPANWREQKLFREGPVTVFRWVNAPGWPVEYCSPNVRQFGYSAEDLTSGRVPYARIVHPEDLARVAEEVAQHSASGVASFEQDYRIVRPDGDVREIFDRTVVVRDPDGKITHYDGYVIDITERRRAERERRDLELQVLHHQKLESLGVLAGGIAHDFNNLLHAILGNASLALEKFAPDDPVRTSVEAIATAATRAAELTSEMLAYSGRGRFHVETLDLNRLVTEMPHLLKSVLSKRADVRFDLERELPPVAGDAAQLRQVVMNLLTNASDALGEKSGTIRLVTRTGGAPPEGAENALPREPLPAEPSVVLEVSDDGCGMDEPTLHRIFEPFFTTKLTGRGLGLAAVLGIVRGHGAAMFVKSRKGEGTIMHLRFPIAEETSPVRTARAPTALAEARGGPILLVDDEPQVRDVVRKMLERLGHPVAVAGRADEALELFRATPGEFVAALVDLTLPDSSGDALLESLRRLRPGLPVLLSSGYDEQDTRPRLATSERFGFLRKPYTLAELDSALRELLPLPAQ